MKDINNLDFTVFFLCQSYSQYAVLRVCVFFSQYEFNKAFTCLSHRYMFKSKLPNVKRKKNRLLRDTSVSDQRTEDYTSRIKMCKGNAKHCVTRRYTKSFGFTLLFASSPIGPIFCVVLFFCCWPFYGSKTVFVFFSFSPSLSGIVLLCTKYFIWRDNSCMDFFFIWKEYWTFMKRWYDWIVSIWTVRFWFELFTFYCMICLLSDIICVQINLDTEILLSRNSKRISRNGDEQTPFPVVQYAIFDEHNRPIETFSLVFFSIALFVLWDETDIERCAHEMRITNLCNTLCKHNLVECEFSDSICVCHAHADSVAFVDARKKEKNCTILWVVPLCPFAIASNDREQQRLSNDENRSIPRKLKFSIMCV